MAEDANKKEKGKLNKKIIIIVAVVVVAIISIVLVLLFGGKKSEAESLEDYMRELGKIYYEDVYYEGWKTDPELRTKVLSDHSATGINADLSNLVRTVSGKNDLRSTDEILAKFVNKETGQECSRTNSRVYFYPNEPYGKTDYRMEIKLDCGFEEK